MDGLIAVMLLLVAALAFSFAGMQVEKRDFYMSFLFFGVGFVCVFEFFTFIQS